MAVTMVRRSMHKVFLALERWQMLMLHDETCLSTSMTCLERSNRAESFDEGGSSRAAVMA
ncbi:hypothetical protein QTI66_26960 [Variovorax sp. J22R133]|uniref:hypothetical protein n=1 Tax=Variovorax brevis TaxID=3053503 RepID=UPI00257562AF|nr:hypothetical protein [Variovorax sp. J22R133]MDM0115818.1 hypothetical protein [Variovorax sp. J22R133]